MLTTRFTRMFGLDHPVALAPMGGVSGGRLAAAVSEAGGLGMVGGGRGDADWLDRELALVRAGTDRPWGVGFLSWAAGPGSVDRALDAGPAAVLLSFGDPGTHADRVRRAGCTLIIQVTDLDEARRAVDEGADLIVAQGSEAGGHGGTSQGTLAFVPVVVDLVAPTPVLAAGGVADGRGLAAALVLGADGALVGTRFQATPEALVTPATSRALLEGSGADTERNRILDIARGAPWPERYPARTLRTGFLERWRGRDQELRDDAGARAAFRAAAARDDPDAAVVWAGAALDLVTDSRPAAEVVAGLVADAGAALAAAGNLPG